MKPSYWKTPVMTRYRDGETGEVVLALVEALGRLADFASGFSVYGVYFDERCMTENVAALEAVRTALAPFQQEAK